MSADSSYRGHFQSPDRAEAYDFGQYGDATYSTLLWGIERTQLDRIVQALGDQARYSYLDFACGTGRVIQHVGPHFSRAVGIDVSEAMLKRARKRNPASEFICFDTRSAPDAVNEQFDLITAFRFILNADADDRYVALSWLRRRLRKDTGRLLVNNHGNFWSHKIITHGMRRIARGTGERRLSGNVLSDREARRLFATCGFEVEAVHGCGLLGGRVFGVTPYRVAEAIEVRGAESPLHRAGVNQLYVLRVRDDSRSG